jgi:AcrR family transcriptional regulator
MVADMRKNVAVRLKGMGDTLSDEERATDSADPQLVARPKPKRGRDADMTRQRILKAAKAEFAKHGLAGARVDAIAARAKANKRMIYHYFAGKDDLFRAVLEEAYANIRGEERELRLDGMQPEDAMRRLVEFTFTYYVQNPEFLTLVNSENLHKGRHLKKSPRIREMQQHYVDLVDGVLRRGVAAGVFRSGIDPVQIAVTIAAIGYYYLTNRFTGSLLFDRDFMAPEALDARLAFNIETIMRLLRTS